jgi:hypothetical protein
LEEEGRTEEGYSLPRHSTRSLGRELWRAKRLTVA